MFGLYTKKQMEDEIERRMREFYIHQEFDRRFERLERRVAKLEHPGGVAEPCCTCTPLED